jgi:hypothetical protein
MKFADILLEGFDDSVEALITYPNLDTYRISDWIEPVL